MSTISRHSKHQQQRQVNMDDTQAKTTLIEKILERHEDTEELCSLLDIDIHAELEEICLNELKSMTINQLIERL